MSSDVPNPAARDARKDLGLIALLLFLVVLLRIWLLSHTVVPARDSIGYIRYALEFETVAADHGLWHTWQTVLNKYHQHPGYSLSILAMSMPVRAWHGGTDAVSMQLSAQLVSALAALLLVLPTYFLGKILFDRQVAFWGALFFQGLPVSGHLLSDGLSEPLFLLLMTTSLLFAVQAVQGGSGVRFALCGLFGGLAYLTRPEGALVLFAAGFVLAVTQMVPGWRRPWRRAGVCALGLLVPACAVGAMYWTATHKFTNKPSIGQIIEGHQANTDGTGEDPVRIPPASLWAASIKEGGALSDRVRRGLLAIGSELAQCYHYFGAVPVLIGLACGWRRLMGHPGFWLIISLCALYTALLCALIVKVGYASDRHVMLIVLCGSFFLAAGGRELAFWLTACIQRLRRPQETPAPRRVLGTAVLVLTLAVCLPKTLQPLHHNRAGHYAAGGWLAHHLQPGDEVQDDHCWSHYYAGRVFEEGKLVRPRPGYEPKHYFVLTRSRDPEVMQVRDLEEARLREADGVLVYHWPSEKPVDRARVVVYAVPQHKTLEHRLVPRNP